MRLIFLVSGYLARMDYVNHIQFEILLIALIARYSGVLRSTISILSFLSVVSNHVLNVTCSLGDLGCISFILWGFEDREFIFILVDALIGTRMHNQFDNSILYLFSKYMLIILYDVISCK
jgi:NADH:ubiquinone oxidoreductase subunit D